MSDRIQLARLALKKLVAQEMGEDLTSINAKISTVKTRINSEKNKNK